MVRLKLCNVGSRSLGMQLELSLTGNGPSAYLHAAVIDELTGKDQILFYIDNGPKLKKFLAASNESVKSRRAAKD